MFLYEVWHDRAWIQRYPWSPERFLIVANDRTKAVYLVDHHGPSARSRMISLEDALADDWRVHPESPVKG